ncbi:MAG: cyclic nucleotide-binding domain-containing protein, partial [Ardenticatenaceae bacterium]|nr:cyclic nucleotide-binding domain-containing protein [Ardenticatenaceae bacterium]
MFQRQLRTSTPRSELERVAWPKLTDELIEILRQAGESRVVQAGDVFFDVGQDGYDFIYIEEGTFEIVDRANDRQVVRIDAGNFVGELGMLVGQKTFFAGIAGQNGRFIVVPRPIIKELVAKVPEISDVIVTAFAARRRLLLEWGEGGLVILGEEGDRSTLQLLEFASRNRIPHRWVDRADAAAVAELAESCDLPESGTAAIIGRSEVIIEPSPRELS